MKKIFFVSLFTLLLAFSLSAYAGEGFYMGANIGLSMSGGDLDLKDNETGKIDALEYDSGIALGAAAGYDFGSARIEGEFVYQKNDFDKLINPDGDVSEASSGDLSSIALLINGYYDFHNNTKFIPFVTAGLGFAKVELNNIVHVKRAKVTDAPYNDDDTVFAYQVGAGVGYAVTEKITIESKYRYFATSDFEITDGTEKLEHNRHNLLFGIRVGF